MKEPTRNPILETRSSQDRYDNCDLGYLHDKPNLPEDFDINQSSPDPSCEYCGQNGQAFIGSSCCQTASRHLNHSANIGHRTPTHQPSEFLSIARTPESREVRSVSSERRSRCEYPTYGSTRNASPEQIALNTHLQPHGKALRSGRTYQDYVDAQAFAKDLTETQPLMVLKDNLDFWPRKAELKPVRHRPATASRTTTSKFLQPNKMMPPSNLNQHHCSVPGSAKQKAFASGIPVRAT